MFLLGIILQGCCPGCGDRKYYDAPLYLSSHVIQHDGKLYFQYYSQNGDTSFYKPSQYNMNESYLFEFDTSDHTWKEIASKIDTNITIANDYNETKIRNLYKPFDLYSTDKMLISDNHYVVIEQTSVKIKQFDNNTVVDEYVLPSLNDILSSLAISYNTFEKIEYYPLFSHIYNPSKKEYLAVLFFDKQNVHAGYNYTCCYITMKFQNNSWNYELVKKDTILNIDEDRNNLTQELFLTFNDGNLSVSYSSPHGDYKITAQNGNISFYEYSQEDFYNKETLYGQFVSRNYSFGENEIYDGNYGVPTYDEKGNMHLFYNKREDIVNENYDYFWYAYFEKENPTTPLYEQKIEWK